MSYLHKHCGHIFARPAIWHPSNIAFEHVRYSKKSCAFAKKYPRNTPGVAGIDAHFLANATGSGKAPARPTHLAISAQGA